MKNIKLGINNYDNYDDKELLVLLKEEPPLSERAFEVIWNRYSNKLMQYCRLKCKNNYDAEELFQHTWVDFFECAKKERNIYSVKFYLFKIAYVARSRNLNSIKKSNTYSTDVFNLDNYEDINTNFLEAFENQDILNFFYIAVDCLDPKVKEALLLHWVAGFSLRDVAEICNEQYDTIRHRCHRGMEKVISLMSPTLDPNNTKKAQNE